MIYALENDTLDAFLQLSLSFVFLEPYRKPTETSGKSFPADFTGLWITLMFPVEIYEV